MDSYIKSAAISAITAVAASAIVVPILIKTSQISTNTVANENGAEVKISREVVQEESGVIEAVAKADKAVVSVIISKDLPVVERYYEEGNPFGDLFGNSFGDDFFGSFGFRIPQYREKGTQKQEIGGGTAYFISSDGLLLTNKHVVSDEDAEYTVLLNDERKLEAKVIARDPSNDIAILKAEGEGFDYLKLSGDELKLGQTVIAIGNALGEFRNTVSKGVISGLKRSIVAGSGDGRTEKLESIIQTDAAISRGNSGGPLINVKGEVVGMSTAVAYGGENIGFAIPSADLKAAVSSYREHGSIVRPLLGIRYLVIDKDIQEKNSLKFDYGVLIVRGEDRSELAVVPGSPADKAGLEENDIILEVDGIKLTEDKSLAQIIKKKSIGDTVRLKVFHDGKERDVSVMLEKMNQ